ncbi:MAG: hypothetical protein M1371_11585 [Actinobacteria bacterium]|nr:hypothetical protein [Actinomycetota bacterium]
MIDLKWVIYAAVWLMMVGTFGLAFKRRMSMLALSFLFLVIGVELILTTISVYVKPDSPSGPALAIISTIIFALVGLLGIMSSVTMWSDGHSKREFSLFAFKLTDIEEIRDGEEEIG